MSSAALNSGPLLRLCRIVTVPVVFTTWLREQIKYILDAGIDLTLVSNPGPELEEIARAMPTLRCYPIAMTRRLSPGRDLKSLWELTYFLRYQRFDIVHSSTPKAGVLTALAGAMSNTPVRIHTYTGQVWVEMRGLARWLAREFDRLIGRLNTATYADSVSQREFLISEGLVAPAKIRVLGAGSISGVNLQRFNPAQVPRTRLEMRHQFGISEQSVVIIFVGRVTKDKGIAELIQAFRALRERTRDLSLLLVGSLEPERAPLPPAMLDELAMGKGIHVVGFTAQPERYLATGDILCLPSYREGFGSVAIEAGAMGLPVVATRVTGLVDAVIDGETGLLVPPKDVRSLTGALQKLIDSPTLRHRMGQVALQRVRKHFDSTIINQAVVEEYFRWRDGNGDRAHNQCHRILQQHVIHRA